MTFTLLWVIKNPQSNPTLEYYQAKKKNNNKKKMPVMTTWNQSHHHASSPPCCAIFISINQRINIWNFSIQIELYWPALKLPYLTTSHKHIWIHVLTSMHCWWNTFVLLFLETSCAYLEPPIHWSITKTYVTFYLLSSLTTFVSNSWACFTA